MKKRPLAVIYGMSIAAIVLGIVFGCCLFDDIPMFLTVKDLTSEDLVWKNTKTLTAQNAVANQGFGYSVDVYTGKYGTYIGVGAPEESSQTGAVYMYRKTSSGWTFIQKITPSDSSTDDYFGYCVKFTGTTLIISAPGYMSSNDGVYVYEFNGSTWQTPASLSPHGRLPLEGASHSYFGLGLAVSGDYIFIGDLNNTYFGNYGGMVYVYDADDYSYIQDLNYKDYTIEANDQFGVSLCGSDDFLFVGASGDDDGQTNAGAIYMYRNDGGGTPWTCVTKIQSPAIGLSEYYGSSLAMDGSRVLIGEPGLGGTNNQRAYLYTIVNNNDLNLLQTFQKTDNNISQYGKAVALLNDIVLISDPDYNDIEGSLSNIGKAFLYEEYKETYTELEELQIAKTTPSSADHAGFSITLKNNIFCVGIPNDDTAASESGAVLVYELTEP